MLWTLVRKYTKPYLSLIILAVVLQLASTLATLYLPSLNARIIDEGVVQGDTAFIWRVGGLMLAVAFGQVVSAVLAVWCGARVAMAAGRDMRTGVYQRVDSFSSHDVSRFGAATLITRGTNDVNQVQMLTLMALNFMVAVPIMAVGGIIMAIREDPGLSWLVWVSVPVLLVIVAWIVARLMPLFQRMQDNGCAFDLERRVEARHHHFTEQAAQDQRHHQPPSKAIELRGLDDHQIRKRRPTAAKVAMDVELRHGLQVRVFVGKRTVRCRQCVPLICCCGCARSLPHRSIGLGGLQGLHQGRRNQECGGAPMPRNRYRLALHCIEHRAKTVLRLS